MEQNKDKLDSSLVENEIFEDTDFGTEKEIIKLSNLLDSKDSSGITYTERINLPFYENLKTICNQHSETSCKRLLGIRPGYTSFTGFYKGDDPELKRTGLNSIMDSLGYNLMLLPLPDEIPLDTYNRLQVLHKQFLDAVAEALEADVKETNSPKNSKPTNTEPLVNTDLLSAVLTQKNTLTGDICSHIPNTDEQIIPTTDTADKYSSEDLLNSINNSEFNLGDLVEDDSDIGEELDVSLNTDIFTASFEELEEDNESNQKIAEFKQ